MDLSKWERFTKKSPFNSVVFQYIYYTEFYINLYFHQINRKIWKIHFKIGAKSWKIFKDFEFIL